MTLAEYLELSIREPWEWGLSDCSTFPADWILALTGIDPMDEWRGAYASEGEANDIIAEAGSLTDLFGRGIDPIWQRCDEPTEGCVGVIVLRGEDGREIEVGAIHTGRRWAVRSPRGLAMLTEPLGVRAIWAR